MTLPPAATSPVPVAVEVLPHGEGIELPALATPGSAGRDVRAAVAEPITLAPGQVTLVPTGLRFAIPEGFEIQVRPRSGLALRNRIGLLNSPGTIDSDYRGELQVILMNFGTEPFVIHRGDRIAQLVLARVEAIQWAPVEALENTQRGEGGFGSSGRT